jgi:glycosyltransferase involved in cell wall biosynthesis
MLDRVGRVIAATLDERHDRRVNPRPLARVAINRRTTASPWGGGNQWARLVTERLRSAGYSVRYRLDGRIDCIVMTAVRASALVPFGIDEIRDYRRRYGPVPCIHRINDNGRHRGETTTDALLARANEVADFTVFISEWARDYHASQWFDVKKPHAVILNGADSRVFHPGGNEPRQPGRPLRLVTHHWSNNWSKGFETYREIDRRIADGTLADTELWVIGRWPADIRWQAAKTIGPRRPTEIATLLRQCDVYVTASRWEAGGMHFIEGAQCGLPVLYHVDGGGVVEVARNFGISFTDDVIGALEEMRRRYLELRSAVLTLAPSGGHMSDQYQRVIQDAIAARVPTAP